MSTLNTNLNNTLDRLLHEPEYLVKCLLQKDDAFYRMLLVKSCGSQAVVRTRYPELFV